MNLTQKTLFWGMNIEFVKAATELSVSISGKNGDTIFNAANEAQCFFILLKGQVTIKQVDEESQIVNRPGEIFGWPALIRRTAYGATASYTADTELVKIEREPFLALLDEAPQEKAALFEGLARNFGNKLLETNKG